MSLKTTQSDSLVILHELTLFMGTWILHCYYPRCVRGGKTPTSPSVTNASTPMLHLSEVYTG